MVPESGGGVAWTSVALAGVLSAVRGYSDAVRACREGRDPSEDHLAASTRHELRLAAAEGETLLHRWRMARQAALISTGSDAADVHHLAGLLAASRLYSVISTIHRHLMGLYPAVAPETVESARIAAGTLSDWIAEPGDDARLAMRLGDLLEEARRA